MTSTNVSTKTDTPVSAFNGFLEKFKPQLALALPRHMNADRMARLALTAFSSSSKLQECDPMSIAASIMTAGQLGLEPGVNGAGFLIPYGRTCTFVPGWKGLVDLVARSGRGTVYTGVIFSDQDYTYVDGAKRDLVIHNETELDAPEDITHAYAIGWVRDATMPIIELWSVGKIKKHRDKYNKVSTKHYSFRDWEMYCRKIPLLQVLKYMPASIELSNALDINNASEAGRGATIENGVVIDMDAERDGTQSGGMREVAAYLQDQFDKNLPGWRKLIADGKKTADDIIRTAETKGKLNDAQKAAINGTAAPAENGDGVMTTEEIAAIHAREMAEAGQ
jgi:recombination protein RecT